MISRKEATIGCGFLTAERAENAVHPKIEGSLMIRIMAALKGAVVRTAGVALTGEAGWSEEVFSTAGVVKNAEMKKDRRKMSERRSGKDRRQGTDRRTMSKEREVLEKIIEQLEKSLEQENF